MINFSTFYHVFTFKFYVGIKPYAIDNQIYKSVTWDFIPHEQKTIKIMEKILQTLKNGEIVAFAGDIGWLIACDTRNQNACENLKNIYLNIPTDKSKTPLTVILKEIGLLNTHAKGIPEVAWDIIDFEENPLSIVFDVVQGLPITLENTTNTAVRFVKHGQTKDILHKFGRPLLCMLVSADFLKNNAAINYIDTKEETATPKHTLMRLGEGGDVKFLAP